MFAVVFVR